MTSDCRHKHFFQLSDIYGIYEWVPERNADGLCGDLVCQIHIERFYRIIEHCSKNCQLTQFKIKIILRDNARYSHL